MSLTRVSAAGREGSMTCAMLSLLTALLCLLASSHAATLPSTSSGRRASSAAASKASLKLPSYEAVRQDDSVQVLMCKQSCLDSVEDMEIRMLRNYERFGTFIAEERACISGRLTQFCNVRTEDKCIKESAFGKASLDAFAACLPGLTDPELVDTHSTDSTDSSIAARYSRAFRSSLSSRAADGAEAEQKVNSVLPDLDATSSQLVQSHPQNRVSKPASPPAASRQFSSVRDSCRSGHHWCCVLVADSQSASCFAIWCVGFSFRCE